MITSQYQRPTLIPCADHSSWEGRQPGSCQSALLNINTSFTSTCEDRLLPCRTCSRSHTSYSSCSPQIQSPASTTMEEYVHTILLILPKFARHSTSSIHFFQPRHEFCI